MSSEIDGCSVLARQVYSTVLKMASGNTIRTTTVMDGLGVWAAETRVVTNNGW
jgi:hypothetical protein